VSDAASSRFLGTSEAFFLRGPGRVSTILGSCVAGLLACPGSGRWAVFHALLPQAPAGWSGTPYRYVDASIRALLDRFARAGVPASSLEAKLFGGAAVLLSGQGGAAVGEQNAQIALAVLQREGLRLSASDLGGCHGRKLFFEGLTGKVLVRRLAAPILTAMGQAAPR